MRFEDYQELSINNHLLRGDKLLAYCQASPVDNIRALGTFLADWISPCPTLTVQTSGSTGEPQQIIVEKQQMLQSAAATAKFFDFQRGQTALLCLPMSYIAGKMMAVRALYSHLNLLCFPPSHNPFNALPKDTAIDFAPLTPMQLKDTADTYAIRKILLGGGPVSPAMEESFQGLKAAIYHGYGMTETLSHVALRSVNGSHRSEAYHALPGVHFQTDERGCLIIHTPFLKQPVVTNDIVTLIDKGAFIWQGRIDNVINSGGIKLSPERIEKKLAPFIPERFFVAGLPDSHLHEKLCLFIEGGVYSVPKLQVLQEAAERVLHKYERPWEVFFINSFLTTTSGKVQRQKTLQAIALIKPVSLRKIFK